MQTRPQVALCRNRVQISFVRQQGERYCMSRVGAERPGRFYHRRIHGDPNINTRELHTQAYTVEMSKMYKNK